MPIISIGIIAFTKNDSGYRFLMIRRKDTLGFMDFIRGKYSIYNKEYILNLLKEMTLDEKSRLLTQDFDTIWKDLWKITANSQYKFEELAAKDKFDALTSGIMTGNQTYCLKELIEESNIENQWEEAEWGFPKGRRNNNEKDIHCALREFTEETGYPSRFLKNVDNLQPFEEIFMGSNHKSYKHKYYLMQIDDVEKCETRNFDTSEVSKLEWKTYETALECIRPYNLEKKRLITDVFMTLTNYIRT